MSEVDYGMYASLVEDNAAETRSLLDVDEGGGNSGKFDVIPEGQYPAYLVRVIETGKFDDEFEGKSKGLFPHVELTWAVFPNWFDADVPDDHEDKKKYVLIDMWRMPIKHNPKARSVKFLNVLNYRKSEKVVHFASLFGMRHPYLVNVTVSETKRDGKTYTRNRLNVADGGFAGCFDPRTKKVYEMPQADFEDHIMFLWNKPLAGEWNKLPDYMKERIMGAANYKGSLLELGILDGEFKSPDPDRKKKAEQAKDKAQVEAEEQPVEEPEVVSEEVLDVAMPDPDDIPEMP